MTRTKPTYKGRLQRLLASTEVGGLLLETASKTKVTSLRSTANSLSMKVSAISFENGKEVRVDGVPGWRLYLVSKPEVKNE